MGDPVRRSGVFRLSLVAAAGLVLAVGVVAGVLFSQQGPAERRIAIDAVYADQQTLRVHLTYSSCDELDRVDVAEDDRAVRVSAYVHDRPEPSCGTAPIDRRIVDVRLHQPVGERSVVDAETGGTVLVR
jgi:hypothetical protein